MNKLSLHFHPPYMIYIFENLIQHNHISMLSANPVRNSDELMYVPETLMYNLHMCKDMLLDY